MSQMILPKDVDSQVPLHHGGGAAGQAAAGRRQAPGRDPQPQAHPHRGRGDDRRRPISWEVRDELPAHGSRGRPAEAE